MWKSWKEGARQVETLRATPKVAERRPHTHTHTATHGIRQDAFLYLFLEFNWKILCRRNSQFSLLKFNIRCQFCWPTSQIIFDFMFYDISRSFFILHFLGWLSAGRHSCRFSAIQCLDLVHLSNSVIETKLLPFHFACQWKIHLKWDKKYDFDDVRYWTLSSFWNVFAALA